MLEAEKVKCQFGSWESVHVWKRESEKAGLDVRSWESESVSLQAEI